MEVILLQKVRNLGGLGDRVKVRAGYGRNYLVPKGIALPATRENLKIFEERRAELMRASEERAERAKARAEQFEGRTFQIPMRASDEGKLYGSVGPQEIVEAADKEGLELDAKEVTLPEGVIRQTGNFTAILQLHAEVEVEIGVQVAQLTDMGVTLPPTEAEAVEAAEAEEEAAAESEEEVPESEQAGEPDEDESTG